MTSNLPNKTAAQRKRLSLKKATRRYGDHAAQRSNRRKKATR